MWWILGDLRRHQDGECTLESLIIYENHKLIKKSKNT